MPAKKRERQSLDVVKAAKAFASEWYLGTVEDFEAAVDDMVAAAWKEVHPETIECLRGLVESYMETEDVGDYEQRKYIEELLLDVEAMSALVEWVNTNLKYTWRLEDILDLADEDCTKTRVMMRADNGRVPKGWEGVLQSALKHISNPDDGESGTDETDETD